MSPRNDDGPVRINGTLSSERKLTREKMNLYLHGRLDFGLFILQNPETKDIDHFDYFLLTWQGKNCTRWDAFLVDVFQIDSLLSRIKQNSCWVPLVKGVCRSFH